MPKIKYITKEACCIKLPIKIHSKDAYMFIPQYFSWDGDTGVYDICQTTSAIHDIIYALKGKVNLTDKHGQKIEYVLSRREADICYKLIQPYHIVGHVRYLGIRAFGWIYWHYTNDGLTISTPSSFIGAEVQKCRHGIKSYYRSEQTDTMYHNDFFYYKC